MPASTRPAGASRAQVIAAFAAVYIIWGSTYLAIRFAVETMPPFLMAGVRFLIAGGLLYAVLRLRGTPRPEPVHWRSALVVGGLLLLAGNGLVSWAEQQVPSALAALLVAVVPVWMALLDWLRPGGTRPRALVFVGLALGFGGVALLATQPSSSSGSGTATGISLIGAAALMVATFCWASGSLYSRGAPFPRAPLMATAIEMLAGGALLVVVATATGEWGQLHIEAITGKSLLALAFLIVFGSLVAFTAYVWLLRHVAAAYAGTYAYVNPVVAVFLGWAFAGEDITRRTILAAVVIVTAVALITATRARSTVHAATEADVPAVPNTEGAEGPSLAAGRR